MLLSALVKQSDLDCRGQARTEACHRNTSPGYCFGVDPFVERLESGFLLSDAPGKFLEEPLVPVELPDAPELIEFVSDPVVFAFGVSGVGFELEDGLPWSLADGSAANAGAPAKSATMAVAAQIDFI
jgi:hypothetical protein